MSLKKSGILKDQSLEYYQKIGFHYPTTTIQEIRGIHLVHGWDEALKMPKGYVFTHYLKHDLLDLLSYWNWVEATWESEYIILLTEKRKLLSEELGLKDGWAKHFSQHWRSFRSDDDSTTTYIIATSKDDGKFLESIGFLSLLSVNLNETYIIEIPETVGYTVVCPVCQSINLDVAHIGVFKDENNNLRSTKEFRILDPPLVVCSDSGGWKFSEPLVLFFCPDHGLYGHCESDFEETWNMTKCEPKYFEFHQYLRDWMESW